MRKALFIALSAAGLLAFTTPALAGHGDETVTVTGEGKCGKCSLKETETCQNVIQTKQDGKTVTYYLTKNDVSEKFHKNLCKGSKKVTAKGTVKEVNGKKELTVSQIKTVE